MPDEGWTRGRVLTPDEWLEQIRLQPEECARLLAYENRSYKLLVDENGYVWHGGIGAGFGTLFKLKHSDTP